MDWRSIFEKKETKIGLYSTVIFHLVLIIVLLITTIGGVVSEETAFVLDFTGQERLEEEIRRNEIKEQASREIEDLLAGRQTVQYRNVAVDRNTRNLKDDRFKNPNQVYDEARELQKKLDASRREALAEQGTDEVSGNSGNENKQESQTYKGPSVISYSLDGRKALYLPVPVYKCYGGGDVSVQIIVNRKGYVVAAKVIEDVSSADECLHRYAVEAAKRSRFSASASAPDRQAGEIVYRFIAQ